jgi:hypothetical protein
MLYLYVISRFYDSMFIIANFYHADILKKYINILGSLSELAVYICICICIPIPDIGPAGSESSMDCHRPLDIDNRLLCTYAAR